MKLIQTVKVSKRSIFKFNTQKAININLNLTNIGLSFISLLAVFNNKKRILVRSTEALKKIQTWFFVTINKVSWPSIIKLYTGFPRFKFNNY